MSMAPPEDEAAQLRECGLQVTAQRVAVLRAVHAAPHGTADEIEQSCGPSSAPISRQAVYDVLGASPTRACVRRIQPAGSPARYEDRVGDNHHHLICRTCGRTVDVDCAVGDAPCLTAADDAGYEIDEAEVIYWGRCPDCVAAASRAAPLTAFHDATASNGGPDVRTGSESENPVIAAPTPKPRRPHTNQDWWPDQLDLQVLHQHSPRPNPMGDDFDYAEEFATARPRRAEAATSSR